MTNSRLTNAQRQKRFEDNMRRNGYSKVVVWVPHANKHAFIQLARELRFQGEIPDCSLIQYFEDNK